MRGGALSTYGSLLEKIEKLGPNLQGLFTERGPVALELRFLTFYCTQTCAQ